VRARSVSSSSSRIAANVAGSLGLLGLYGRLRDSLKGTSSKIMLYHNVCPPNPPWGSDIQISPAVFEREIEYLCRVAQVVPLDWLVGRLRQGQPLPRNAVSITFDDGYRNNYEFAYPVLRKYGAPATVFLAVGWVGGDSLPCPYQALYAVWHTTVDELQVPFLGRYSLRSRRLRRVAAEHLDAYLSTLPPSWQERVVSGLLDSLNVSVPADFADRMMLSWDEVREMAANGVTIGSHTLNHAMLTSLSADEARHEIGYSKRQIEDRLGQECRLFAYPFGDFDASSIELVEDCGYEGAVTTVPTFVPANAYPLSLGRVPTGQDLHSFEACNSGLYTDLVTLSDRLTRKRHPYQVDRLPGKLEV
jgi:peptidoglycan/xylan/chitin deacetylase (PgdA/CDA1 family)